jgi:hypothetical protein
MDEEMGTQPSDEERDCCNKPASNKGLADVTKDLFIIMAS